MPTPKYATRAEAISALTAAGQTYELQQMTIRGRALRVFRNAPNSLRDLYAAAVSDKTFIVYETERLTFAEAWAEAGRIGALLVRDYGVRPGDRVAISMRNYPEWILAFMAVTSIGAIAVAMNALWQPDEMAYGLSDSGAKVLFADQERLDRLAQAGRADDVRVISVRAAGSSVEAADLKTLLAALGPADMPPAAIAPDDDAMIFYTSGSTGHPKGVISTHRNVLSALLSWELDLLAGAELAGITPEPPAVQPAGLLAVPLFHVTGANAIFLQAYRAQRKLVCMYRWDPERAAELIEVEKISSFTAPAAMTGDLVRVAKQTARDLGSLISVGGGGAPRAPEQVKQIEASFGQALPATGWGMTETNAIGTGIGGLDYLGRPASSGRCSAVLDLKIIDEQGNTLPAGERGELLVRGTSVFFGY
jgi:long-chain acyl-CoA synthetase